MVKMKEDPPNPIEIPMGSTKLLQLEASVTNPGRPFKVDVFQPNGNDVKH